MAQRYLNPSLVLLQVRCFRFDLTFLFVLAMTHVRTEAFCFLAFMRWFFLEASLFLPNPLNPPDFEFLLAGPLDGLEELFQLLVVDRPLEPPGGDELDDVLLDGVGDFRLYHPDVGEPLSGLGGERDPDDVLAHGAPGRILLRTRLLLGLLVLLV